MAVVCHNCQDVTDNEEVEILIKYRGYLWLRNNEKVECLQCLETYLHGLRLLMLDSKQNGKDHNLELVCLELEETTSAVLDYLLNELEAAFSELRIRDKVILDHVQC